GSGLVLRGGDAGQSAEDGDLALTVDLVDEPLGVHGPEEDVLAGDRRDGAAVLRENSGADDNRDVLGRGGFDLAGYSSAHRYNDHGVGILASELLNVVDLRVRVSVGGCVQCFDAEFLGVVLERLFASEA